MPFFSADEIRDPIKIADKLHNFITKFFDTESKRAVNQLLPISDNLKKTETELLRKQQDAEANLRKQFHDTQRKFEIELKSKIEEEQKRRLIIISKTLCTERIQFINELKNILEKDLIQFSKDSQKHYSNDQAQVVQELKSKSEKDKEIIEIMLAQRCKEDELSYKQAEKDSKEKSNSDFKDAMDKKHSHDEKIMQEELKKIEKKYEVMRWQTTRDMVTAQAGGNFFTNLFINRELEWNTKKIDLVRADTLLEVISANLKRPADGIVNKEKLLIVVKKMQNILDEQKEGFEARPRLYARSEFCDQIQLALNEIKKNYKSALEKAANSTTLIPSPGMT